MSPEVISTAYGKPAFDALTAALRAAKQDEPLAAVTVVVPSNHVGVTIRRALGRAIGIIGVGFLTPSRLAEQLGAARLAEAQRRPVSTPVVAAALRQALRNDPGVFAPVAEHPATEEALVAAFDELGDVSPAGRARLAATGRRAADVVRLCDEVRALLADDWYDESDLFDTARRSLAARSVDGLGQLIVYLPQDLSRGAAMLLSELLQRTSSQVIVGLTGDAKADAGVHQSLTGLLGKEGGHFLESRSPDSGPLLAKKPLEGTRVVSVSDADDEVRIAVREVLNAARHGTPLERIAILYPNEVPYARLLHEHMQAAGIPSNGTAVHGLKASVLGRTMLNLLALPDHGYKRRDVMGLLTSAPLASHPPTTPVMAPTSEWERTSREAAVVEGRRDWDERLTHHADEIDQRADKVEDPDDDDERRARRVERIRRRAERVRSLRDLVLQMIDGLEGATRAMQTWRERVRWLREQVKSLLGGEPARDDWPVDERKAAEKVEAALDRLITLDSIDGPVSMDVFRRTLEIELDADLGRVGRFGEGVLVAPLSFGVGLDLDLLVVVGMAEGILPMRRRDDSLLPDAEREATGGEMRLRRDHAERQHRQLLAAFAAAERRLLCAPRGDLRASNEHVQSRWLPEIEPDIAASFAAGVRNVAFPSTEQEYRLRVPAVAAADPLVVAGRRMRAARRSGDFTRYDGNLTGLPIDSPLDDAVSATRIERWAICPREYFFVQLLGVRAIDDPATELQISPIQKGSLVHEVLERFILDVLDRPPDAQPGPDQPWPEEDHQLMRRITGEVCAEFEGRGVVGRQVFWRRDRARIIHRLQHLLTEDDAYRRATRSRPIAAEMQFGFPESDVRSVSVPLGDGRALQFHGLADRVDVSEDGTIRVIDYKTGKPDEYKDLTPAHPDDHGTHLQLVVYGLAARALRGDPDTPVQAEYWFVGDRTPDLEQRGYTVTDDIINRVGRTIATIVDGIAGGIFPAHPDKNSTTPFTPCRYCDPDELGVADLRREWDRKRDDPRFAHYAELAEPRETAT